jgi:hypothetical protein
MSLTITTDVFCDGVVDGEGCHAWTEGVTHPTSVQATDARERAKAKGWTRRKRDGRMVDLCPLCSNEE